MTHACIVVCCVAKSFTQDDVAQPFRYKVTAAPRVYCYEPKKLPENASLTELRASMFGAYFLGKFGKLPKSKMAGLLWEAQ